MAGQKQFAAACNRRKLTVRVMSFSYRKGIPEDPSENGGGYVFDCRGVHNPGRYDRYKPLTGRDEPVIRFLEEDGEILRFLEHTDALVDAHVERYLERGFTHLRFVSDVRAANTVLSILPSIQPSICTGNTASGWN